MQAQSYYLSVTEPLDVLSELRIHTKAYFEELKSFLSCFKG